MLRERGARGTTQLTRLLARVASSPSSSFQRYRSLSASGLTPETSHDMKQLQGLIGLFQKAHEWK